MGVIDKVSVGGTTYDVQDARVAPLDERVNALHTLVNYGYDICAFNNYRLKSRVGTRVVLDGTTTGTVNTRIILTGEPMYVRSNTFPSTVTSGVRLTNGHRYRLYTVYISGSTLKEVNPYWTAPGSWDAPTGTTAYGDGYCILDYNTTDYPNGAIAYLSTPTANTLSDYTVQVIAEDITYGEAGDGNFAPVDTPTATSTHTTGSLLMMGGTLYKATSAIAVGDTIASYASATTVADELAARDTAIAAEATARAAEDTALTTFNGVYPSTAWGSGGTDSTYGVTITAVRNRVTINGTRTGTNTGVNYSFLNGIAKTTGSSGADVEGDTLVSENFVAKAGHKYRFTMRVLSGSYTKGSGGASFRLYKKAGTAAVSHDGFVWNQSITSPAEFSFVEAFTVDTQLGIGMFMGSNAGAFSSLVIEYSVTDETNTLPNKPSSDGTYTLQCVVSDGVPTYSWISAT